MINGIGYEKIIFPCGEIHVKIDPLEAKAWDGILNFQFEKNEEIIELLLLNDAIQDFGLKIKNLHLNYVPFSRQDRVAIPGEAFSLRVFCELINRLEAEAVLICDPHSDVTPALLKNCHVITQSEIFARRLAGKEDFWLISPDGGALKKIYKLVPLVAAVGVVECSKLRDTKTGEISRTIVHADDMQGKECIIVDDICDGGRTFIEIAKVLKEKNAGKITLAVTHGFFTQGLEVFDGLIDEIYTQKGKIK